MVQYYSETGFMKMEDLNMESDVPELVMSETGEYLKFYQRWYGDR